MANEAIKITQVKRRGRPSYVAQLLELEVGKPTYFRLIGTAYTGFYNAKWQIERKKQSHYELRKVNETTLKVTRLD